MDDSLLLLLDTPLFANITPQQLPALLSCLRAEKKTYQKGETILAMGSKARYVGILLSGAAQVVEDDLDGNRAILTNLTTGDLFCETFACAQVEEIPITVIAMDTTEAVLIEYTLITTTCSIACDFHNKLLENMMFVLATKNLTLNSKLRHISKRSIREKLLSYLQEHAQKNKSSCFTIPFNRQELADFLCVDRSALSAELSRMQTDGVLEYQKNSFTLFTDTFV